MKKIFNIKILDNLNFFQIKFVKFFLYIFAGVAFYKIIKIILQKVKKNKLSKKVLQSNKIDILFSIILSIIKYIIYFITILLILRDVFNVNPALIVTATGVLGLAVGLGIQGLLRDFVSGLFILFENQFNIGDYVVLNNIKGKVVNFNIKNVKIVDSQGKINIIPNGKINNIIRYPKKYEKIKFHLFYSGKYNEIKKVYSHLKNNILERYKRIIKEFSELSCSKKVSNFNYSNFTIFLTPFNDEVVENLKELFQKNFPGILVYIDKLQ